MSKSKDVLAPICVSRKLLREFDDALTILRARILQSAPHEIMVQVRLGKEEVDTRSDVYRAFMNDVIQQAKKETKQNEII